MNEISATWVQRLLKPACYSHPVNRVRVVETHISWVVLTGLYVYKIKKPVKYSFVDFSTLEKRRWFCEEEVRLNRRLAPDVYLGIIPITGSLMNPHIDGQGTPFEFAVKMKQFSAEQEIHNILVSQAQAENFILQLANKIATFHAKIEKAGEHLPYGNPDMVWRPMKECLDEMPLRLLIRDTQKRLNQIDTWLQKEWNNL